MHPLPGMPANGAAAAALPTADLIALSPCAARCFRLERSRDVPSDRQTSFLHAASEIPSQMVPHRAKIWLRQFDRGFSRLQEEVRHRDERICQLEEDARTHRATIERLENTLERAAARIRCCVFIHIPRTAGSSVWSCLVETASNLGIGVCDLYCESIQRYGDPARVHEVLQHTPPPSDRETRCVFHHHTNRNISEFFRKNETVYATMLRDPVDRFVSDAFHYKRLLKGAPGAEESWKPDLVSMSVDMADLNAEIVEPLRPNELRTREILEIAAAQPSFANYYFKFFWSLLGNEAAPDGRYGPDDVLKLAMQLRRQFDVIGSFDDLERSYAEITAAFGMAADNERLRRHIMKGHAKPEIADSEKRQFRRLFELDYRLLDLLGE